LIESNQHSMYPPSSGSMGGCCKKIKLKLRHSTILLNYQIIKFSSGCCTVVEQLMHDCMLEDLKPAIADTQRENIAKKVQSFLHNLPRYYSITILLSNKTRKQNVKLIDFNQHSMYPPSSADKGGCSKRIKVKLLNRQLSKQGIIQIGKKPLFLVLM
jgi:hypothetical protein